MKRSFIWLGISVALAAVGLVIIKLVHYVLSPDYRKIETRRIY